MYVLHLGWDGMGYDMGGLSERWFGMNGLRGYLWDGMDDVQNVARCITLKSGYLHLYLPYLPDA